jgi:hypothetical protein
MRRASLGLMAMLPIVSFAHPAASADDGSAEDLLRAGVKLRHEGLDEAALALFERAAAIASTPVTRAQIALAEQALGRWLESDAQMRVALEAEHDPWIVANRAALDVAHDEIARHLGWLTVDVGAPSAPSVDIHFGGHPVAPSTETRVVAGSDALEVRAAGYAPSMRRVEVPPGEHTRLVIALTALRPDRPADPGSAGPAAHRSLVGPIVLASLGVAGIGVGSYFGVRTFDQKSARDAACPGGVCTEVAAADDSSARASARVSTVAFTAGLAFAAAAAAWWRIEGPSPSPARVAWRAMPVIDGRSAGVGITGALP